MFSTPFQRVIEILHRFRNWLGLSVSGAIAVLAGLAIAAAAGLVFGGVTEDVTQHNGAASADPGRLQWFVQHRTHALVSVSRVLTDIGSPVVLVLGAMLIAAVLWACGQRLAFALAPGLALGVAGASAGVLKTIVGRSRPPIALHLVAESDASFPSGHSTDSAALFVTLGLVVALYALRRPIARGVAVAAGALLSGAIGTSRLVLGVHWPTDVLAGWALGLLTALIVTIAVSVVVSVAGKGSISTDRRPRLARLGHFVTLERGLHRLRAS